MPVINFSYSDLCDLMGAEVSREVLRERLPMLGAELRDAEVSSDELSFEFFPDRPDLYSVEGIARALKAFLGSEREMRSYSTDESDVALNVDLSVNEVRPHIWSGLVEGVTITDPLIKSMMDLQEKLHLTLGRNRRKVAIGIHDYRTVRQPFTYKAVRPNELSFVPLQGHRSMTPAEILTDHEKGRAYAFVLEGKERYPIIVDRDGEVLSFPPVINGVTTAVTEDTKDIFVDCTGTDINAVMQAVNILVTALADRGATVKTVAIHREGKVLRAPDLSPREWTLDPDQVNRWLGTSLSVEEMIGCLARAGHGAVRAGTQIRAFVPPYRGDVLHPVDLAEDVAIGYGFEKFGQALPKRATFAREDDLVAFGREVKSVLIGLGYFEVVTLSLSNPREQAVATLPGSEGKAVALKNPVSEDHVLVRTSLLPSLMAILRKNKHRELPQRLFEVGDVVLDLKNTTLLAGMTTHAKAGFTEVKSVVQSVLAALGLEAEVEKAEHPTFLEGRCASLSSGEERHLGVLGEVSPEALEVFELRHPAGAFELDLERLMATSRARR